MEARGAEEGIALTNEEAFRHFRVSYLRLLSSLRRRKELKERVQLAVDRIKKDRLLTKVGIDANSNEPEARAWRQRALGVIDKRLRFWEVRLRGAIPDLVDRDLYRYFRQRYLQVPAKRFEELEIEKGIRNTRNCISKRVGLGELGIGRKHPQYENWKQKEFWEFERKKSKLTRAIEACRRFSLTFPPDGAMNAREFHKHVNAYPKEERPTRGEEMLYKLILYFEGMTWGQLNQIRRKYLTSKDWRRTGLETSLNRLVDLKLLGVVNPHGALEERYYVGRKDYLGKKIEACRVGNLEFARDVDETEVDHYLRWVRDHGEDSIGRQERLLLKLISHYGLVSHRELNNLCDRYLSKNGGKSIWSKSSVRSYLNRMIDLELVEVIGKNGRVMKSLTETGCEMTSVIECTRAFCPPGLRMIGFPAHEIWTSKVTAFSFRVMRRR